MPGDRSARAPAFALYWLALLATAYTLHLARDMVLPLTLAVIFALLLSPLLRRMQRLGVPRALCALLLIGSGLAAVLSVVGLLSNAALDWFYRLPEAGEVLSTYLEGLRQGVQQAGDASASIDKIAEGMAVTPAAADAPTEVVLVDPGWRTDLWIGARNFVVFGGLSVILLFFLLNSGEALVQRIAGLFADDEHRRRALMIAVDAQTQMSRYLLTVTLLNGTLGGLLSLALWLVDFPDPALWGAMAAALRFVPYLGVSLTVIVLAVVGTVSFDSLWMMFGPAAAFGLLASLAGQVIEPLVHGYRFKLDPIIVFVWIFFWGSIWGAPGVLLAVPLLTLVQVVCRHVQPLAKFAQAIGEH